MEKTKPKEWPNRALEIDVEYELRTSAPQEEMERYYRKKKAVFLRKLRRINKKIKKNIYHPYISDNGKRI